MYFFSLRFNYLFKEDIKIQDTPLVIGYKNIKKKF